MATSNYVATASAKADLRNILAYVRQHSSKAATALRLKLYADVRRLAELPYLGHLRPDLTDRPLRFWAIYPYLAVYRPDPRPVEIVRVPHGMRDVEHLLGQWRPGRRSLPLAA